MTHAWLFPGQGSQYPQMGKHIWRHKLAADVLSLAEAISGLPLGDVMENGPDSSLRSPEYLEPSILAIQAAHVLLLREQGLQPSVVAGYSLGEIGALYCAGCLSLEDALKVASERGRILTRHAAMGNWSTRTVTFAEEPMAVPINGTANIYIAAYNSVRDFTITGESAAMREVERTLSRAGAKLLPVGIDGPWHSPLAAGSALEIASLLQSVEVQTPRLPLCLGTSGVFETEPDSIRNSLSRQIDHPVLWTAALATLWAAGVRVTLEIGPNRVLTSFVRTNWVHREYHSQFLDRPGGRVADFAAVKIAQTSAASTSVNEENSWTKSA